jgi:anti-sigma B factor antagonist
MKINTRHIADIVVVDFTGRIVVGEETILLRNTVRDLIADGRTKIILNLSEVPYIDSSGIGELVSAFVAARRAGGSLTLIALSRRVREILQLVKLRAILEIYDTEVSALADFARQDRAPKELTARAG